MTNREALRQAISEARKAQLDAIGGWKAVEAAELDTRWEIAGHSKRQRAHWHRRKGLTYREIGEVMGVSNATVCKWLCPTYAEKQREWFQRNRVEHAARMRDWYQANREQILERRRAQYAARKVSA